MPRPGRHGSVTRNTDEDLPTGFSREPEDAESKDDALVDLPLGPRGEIPRFEAQEPESAQADPEPESSVSRPSLRRWLLPLAALGLVAAGVAVGLLWPRGAPAVARLSESLLDFGRQSVREDAEATPREIVVSNGGTRPLTVASVALTGAAPEDFRLVADGCSGRELDAEGQCTVLVGFHPAGPPGARSASLEVVGDFGNSPVQMPLLGTSVAPVLSLDRHQVVFAPRPVGGGAPRGTGVPATERLVVTNRGTAPLQLGGLTVEGTASGDFPRVSDFCSGRTLRPDERCVMELRFEPTAEGERHATLTVEGRGLEGSRVELSGVGTAPVARLAATPDRIDFGERSVHAPSEALAVGVTNPADSPVEVLAVAIEGDPESAEEAEGNKPDFQVIAGTCRGAVLQPGDGCALRVALTPTREGELTGTLVLRYRPADGESRGEPMETRIPLRGSGVTARLELEPAELTFGEVPVSGEDRRAQNHRTVRLINRGSGSARGLVVELEGPQAAAFAVEGGAQEGAPGDCLDGELAPGSDCGFEVRFRPRGPGAHRARLRVRLRGEAEETGSPAPAVDLTGTGVAPRLVVRPERIDFGRIVVGESAERSLLLANEGRAPLSFGGLTAAGEGAGDFRITGGTCPTGRDGRLGAGESCRLELRVSPRAEGRRIARLPLRHDAPEGPREVLLEAIGLPRPKPELTVTPTALRFGDQTVGRRSAIETVRLRNSGDARLDLHGVRLDGADASDFELVPGTCDGLSFLAPGGDCTVGLRFTPRGPGSRRARLLIRHDAASGPTELALSGLGLEPAEIPGSR